MGARVADAVLAVEHQVTGSAPGSTALQRPELKRRMEMRWGGDCAMAASNRRWRRKSRSPAPGRRLTAGRHERRCLRPAATAEVSAKYGKQRGKRQDDQDPAASPVDWLRTHDRILGHFYSYCQVLCNTKRCGFAGHLYSGSASRLECAVIELQFVTDLGKLLIFLGGMIVLVGLGLVLAGRANFPLGRLPGDFVYRGKNTTVYFPLGTSIVISVVLSGLMYVVGRLRK